MKPRTGVLLCAAALGLGSLTGFVVLPAGGLETLTRPSAPATAVAPRGPTPYGPGTGAPSGPPSPGSPGPTSDPSTGASPSAAPADTTAADLLSVRSFAEVSVEVVDNSPGKPDRTIDATSCVSDDVHVTATLRTVTGHDPVLEGDWTETATGDGARQQVAVAADEEDARQSVTALAVSMQACEEATPGHFVLGPASTQNYSAGRSATWVGFYPDTANRSGRAPTGTEPCGGTLLARNGVRFSTVVVSMCLDGAQLASLADEASQRLG